MVVYQSFFLFFKNVLISVPRQTIFSLCVRFDGSRKGELHSVWSRHDCGFWFGFESWKQDDRNQRGLFSLWMQCILWQTTKRRPNPSVKVRAQPACNTFHLSHRSASQGQQSPTPIITVRPNRCTFLRGQKLCVRWDGEGSGFLFVWTHLLCDRALKGDYIITIVASEPSAFLRRVV